MGPRHKKVAKAQTILYLHVFVWPEGGKLSVPGLRNKLVKASLLATGDQLQVTMNANDLEIAVPERAPDPVVTVIKLQIEEPLSVESNLPAESAEGQIKLPAVMADIHNPGYGIHAELSSMNENAFIDSWRDQRARVAWMLKTSSPGIFQIEAEANATQASLLSVKSGQEKLEAALPAGEGFQKIILGKISLQAGEQFIELSPVAGKWQPVQLRGIELKRVQDSSAPSRPRIKSSGFIFSAAPFESCHASTIVELQNGDMMAAWFGGEREGHSTVAIWGSVLHDGSWSAPQLLAREKDIPCWNPVLFRHEGTLWLFYKAGTSPQTWSGLVITSTDDGKTWSSPVVLPAGLLGPIKNKPIVLANGDIVAGTSTESYKAWTCWVEISSDKGKTWQKYGPIAVPGNNNGIIQPALWETEPGHLKMLTRATRAINKICMATSTDGGHSWSAAQPTSLPNPNSGIDAVKLKNGVIALVYNHTLENRWPLNIAFSADNGVTWAESLTLESERGEFSYPAVIQDSKGQIHITYTWNRKLIKHAVISTN